MSAHEHNGALRGVVEHGVIQPGETQHATQVDAVEALLDPELERTEQLTALASLDELIHEDRILGRGTRTIGSYLILRLLGRGGMGTVFLAERQEDQRLVALKLIDDSLAQADAVRTRFEREGRLARRLRHPNLVAVYDDGRADGYAYYAMEFVPGPTLATVLRSLRDDSARGGKPDLQDTVRRQSRELDRDLGLELHASSEIGAARETYFAAVARVVAELADALSYLHDRQVIHRDVKPENVLMNGAVTPLLTDFGLAKEVESSALTRSGAHLGTPNYMSPEMAAHGAAAVDHRTDIYSAGVTLFELLTLRTPFQGTSTHDVIHRILTEIPPTPRTLRPDIPRDLETIALKAIEKNPANRYQTAHEMAEELRRFLRYERIQTRSNSIWRRVSRLTQRHRRWTAGVVALVLLLLLGWAVTQVVLAGEKQRALGEVRALLEQDRFSEAQGVLEHLGSGRDELHDLRRIAYGTVSVPIRSVPGGAMVTACRLDQATGTAGSPQLLGPTPEEGHPRPDPWLDAGQYRLVVDKPGYGYAECLVTIPWKTVQPEVAVTLRPTQAVLEGMIEIPAGTYPVGFNPPKALNMTPYDQEPRKVVLPAFYLDRHEVTNEEYRRFVEATGARPPWPGGSVPEGEERVPVVYVSWAEANAYAEWAGKRLPSQVEWEAAARGPQGLTYPWGNEFDPERTILGLSAGQVRDQSSAPRAVPVESLTADVSVFGIVGMAGNVREWVFDPWVPRPEVKPEETAQLGIGHRTVRGSSWSWPRSAVSVRSSYRASLAEADRRRDIGFRCAKSKRP